MTRILFLSYYFSPDLGAGAFRSSALAQELANQDVSVDVIATMPNRYKTFSHDAASFERNGKLNIYRVSVPSHRNGKIDQILSFVVFYKKAIDIAKGSDHDLVLATSSKQFTAFLAARVARKKNVPLYLDIRDLFIDTLSDVLPTLLFRLLQPALVLFERYTFKAANKVNLVSPGFADYIRGRFSDVPLSFFTNGIDEEFLSENRPNTTPDAKRGPLRVLYAGNVGEGQGLHKIIPPLAEALAEEAAFKVIGAGGLLSKLREEIKVHKLANVEIVAPINRDSLIAEYEACDVLFLHLNNHPAFEKVLPSKLFEYAAMNKPIWAGLSGYSACFVEVEIENCAVFEPSNVEDALKKLRTLDLSLTARESFVEKFNRTRIVGHMASDICVLARQS